MSRENIIYPAIALGFFVLAGLGAWYVFFFSPNTGGEINVSPTPDISTVPEPSPSPAQTFLREPPAGYDMLKNNNPTMREEFKASYTKKFTELIDRIKADPGNPTLWVDLGSIKYSFNDFAGAEAAWKYAIKINQHADPAYLNLAALYQYKTKDYPEAERMLRASIDLGSPAKLTAYSELFDLYRYRYTAKANLAEGVMLEAYREFPDQHAILKTIAWHFKEIGNKEKAIEYFEKFLVKVPDDASAKEELEMLKR